MKFSSEKQVLGFEQNFENRKEIRIVEVPKVFLGAVRILCCHVKEPLKDKGTKSNYFTGSMFM